MPTQLRIGVIGLGPRWRRYRPALGELRRHLEVSGVCDQSAPRSQRVAGSLGCSPAAGPVDLLERDDVQAVLLFDRQWYGLWPIQLACRLGKPVFCSTSLLPDQAADSLQQQVESARLPVMMGAAEVLAPAVQRLRQLLANHLGPVRLLRLDRSLPHLPRLAETGPGRLLLETPAVLELFQLYAALIGREPASLWTTEAAHSPYLSILIEFGPDRAAQLNLWIDPAGPPRSRLLVVAERGQATGTLPWRLHWRDRHGWNSHQWRRHPMRQTLLQRFALTVRAGQPVQPSFQEAYRALLWQRLALQSLHEGRRVLLSPEGVLTG
jgi:predicted dehydrogenase